MSEKAVPISDEQAQRMMSQQAEKQERTSAMDEQRESMLRAFVSGEGRERLKRIEQVKPERARAVEMQIIQAVRAGKLQPPVGDDTVRELLSSLAGGEQGAGSKITVVRKKAADDDW